VTSDSTARVVVPQRFLNTHLHAICIIDHSAGHIALRSGDQFCSIWSDPESIRQFARQAGRIVSPHHIAPNEFVCLFAILYWQSVD